MTSSFFSLIMIAMALYVLIGGITGKGKLYAVDGVPEEKVPNFRKTLRILYIIMGLFMALNTGLSYLRDQMYTYQPTAAVEQTTAEAALEAEQAAEQAAVEAEQAAETAEPASEQPAEAEPAAETAEAAKEAAASDYELVRTEKYPGINIAYKTLNVLALVMLGITMAAVIGMFVVINKFVDKEAARKAQEEKSKESGSRRGGSGSSMPASAFEFDDEPEETEK